MTGIKAPAVVDAELLLRGWLAGKFPDAVVQTETDELLDGQPFTIKVNAGGGTTRFKLISPTVVLDIYGPNRATVRANALRVDHAMLWDLPRARLGNVADVTRVGQQMGPRHIPDENTSLRHMAATYVPTLQPLASA